MRIVTIIQARMGSNRLPGKVLMNLAGKTMLAWVVSRCRRARTIDQVTVATTTKQTDDIIVELCSRNSWSYSRGSEDDLLDRYYQAALQQRADIVVRITSDCPLIDPWIIDLTVNNFLENGHADYASNTLSPRTYPRGLDVEVFSFEALKRAWQENNNPAWREHVTPYFYYHPEIFRLVRVADDKDYSAMRWTVDTAEDLTLVRNILEFFQNDHFTWHQVINLIENHPEWLEINRHIIQKDIVFPEEDHEPDHAYQG